MKASRILSLLLVISCLFVGCNVPSQQETTPVTNPPEETTLETVPPSCGEDPAPKITMKLEHVTITAGDSPAEQTALAELTEYLEKRSIVVAEGGFSIDLYIDVTLEEDS